MATIYRNPNLNKRPSDTGASKAGYSGYIKPDTKIPPKAKPVTREVSVNGVVIAEETILAEAQNHPAKTPGEAVQSAVKALVIREILLQEAKRLKITAAPEQNGEGHQETEDDALIRALIDLEIHIPRASQDECFRYYGKNKKKFQTQPLFEVRHILIPARPDAPEEQSKARKTAAELCDALASDPAAFAEAAAACSACSSKNNGGRLGQVAPGETVSEFQKALDTMKEGEISHSPVESRFGFHIIALDRRIDGRQMPFEHVHERIAAWLEASTWSKAVSQYIAILSASADISGVSLGTADGPLVQ